MRLAADMVGINLWRCNEMDVPLRNCGADQELIK